MPRFLAGVLVGALLGVTGTVAGAVAAGARQSAARTMGERVATVVTPHATESAPVTVFVNRLGAHVHAGIDARHAQTSAVLLDRGIPEVDVPPYRGSERNWEAFRTCLEGQFAPFAVSFVDERPRTGDFITVHVGGRPSLLGLSAKTGGIAPLSGSVIRNAQVFTFERRGASSRDLCEVAAHEVGHALGLDHSRACRDVMSYSVCGKKTFRDETAVCGEYEARECVTGRAGQNSYQELLRIVGARLQEEPRVS
jgi:hypothetical protein